jgi:hypothetical protein
MPRKVTTKAGKSKSSTVSKSKSSKSAKGKALKPGGAVAQKASHKRYVRRDSDIGKFVSSSKTGRVIKASPAKPRLGNDRIKTAVKSVVCRDARTGKFSD